MKPKKPKLASNRVELGNRWRNAYTREQIRDYANHILDNYTISRKLRATIIAFLIGFPIEYVPRGKEMAIETGDPQWHYAGSILTFRIKGSEREPSN